MSNAAARLQFAIYTPNFGVFGDPIFMAQMARTAEEAGWDGWFLWDNLSWETDVPVADPWVALAAMASATMRIRIGPLVTPLPRRRPWNVARASVTLDHLSAGRMVLGVGLGGDWYRELSAFGEEPDIKRRAAMLDEGLDLVTRLWSGDEITFVGEQYRVEGVRFLPPPVQQPRIPVWVASVWPSPRSLQRAARWDGIVPIGESSNLQPAELAGLVQAVRSAREAIHNTGPFDVVVPVASRARSDQRPTVQSMAKAGATWWLDSVDPAASTTEVEARVSAGPPAV